MVVVPVEDKIINVKDLESERVLRFSTQQIKPFLRDSPSTDVDEDAIEITQAMLSRFTSTDAKEKSPPFQVHLSEVIGPSGPRAALFNAAKQKEIQGLIECGTWKLVLKDDMPENPNIMGGRFVLTIKKSGTSKDSGASKEMYRRDMSSMVFAIRRRPALFTMHLHRSSNRRSC
jgi:hypothetical protein